MNELEFKIQLLREVIAQHKLSGFRFRGVDWFSWITCGASNVVLLAAETGVAEVLLSENAVVVLTNKIEESRLREEELAQTPIEVVAFDWTDNGTDKGADNGTYISSREKFVEDFFRRTPPASDRPQGKELSLPTEALAAKRTLLPAELTRYRSLGKDAAEAMTATLKQATPEWTELELAARGAAELWRRGIHPTLTLAAGAERGKRYRHPTPTHTRLGSSGMLVFCGRRAGLYANLTRFVYFQKPNSEILQAHASVAAVEAAALDHSLIGRPLSETFHHIEAAYRNLHLGNEIRCHHQGGLTGYLSREIVASAHTHEKIPKCAALAWNPSLPGAKIEDTFVLTDQTLECLTVDPHWPTQSVGSRDRPEILVTT